jgi:hypothetical protein
MSKIPAILSATLSVTLAACGKDHDTTPVGQPTSTPLVTPKAEDVGSLTVFNSTDGLFVTAKPGPGWELTQTRLSVSRSAASIPQNKTGKPNCDRFVLRRTKTDASGNMVYSLPLLVDPGTELVLALYAELRAAKAAGKAGERDHGDCGRDDTITAWAQGIPFPAKDGSMYITYKVQSAARSSLAGQYRTHSQENWGLEPDLVNPGGYLTRNFSTAFPQGVTIGSSGGSAQFTTPRAVTDFLPQTGTSGPLSHAFVNPINLANPFAGDLLALSLNAGFDAADPAFSAGTLPITSLVIADPSSPLYGVSVMDVLAMANKHLAGQPLSLGILAGDLYAAVARINANFEGGMIDQGFLGVP